MEQSHCAKRSVAVLSFYAHCIFVLHHIWCSPSTTFFTTHPLASFSFPANRRGDVGRCQSKCPKNEMNNVQNQVHLLSFNGEIQEFFRSLPILLSGNANHFTDSHCWSTIQNTRWQLTAVCQQRLNYPKLISRQLKIGLSAFEAAFLPV